MKFTRSLLNSASPEVVSVANKAMRDRGTLTGSNVARIQEETGLNIWVTTSGRVKDALTRAVPAPPPADEWRIGLLEKLLARRQQRELEVEDTRNVDELIDSLCSS